MMPSSKIAYTPHSSATAETLRLGGGSLALALFFIAGASPVLYAKFPPVADYINHLARCYVIAIGGRDPLLAQFYGIDWRLIPNLAIDLIVPPLAHVFDIYTAGKIFLILTMALLVAGPHIIYHALYRRWSLGPLVATLFLYNGAIEAGEVNYLFGLGVALFGIAFWIRLRAASAARRVLVSTVFILALYICHFGALGLYGVTLLGLESWWMRSDLAYRNRWRSHAIAFFVPFLAIPVLALLGPGGQALVGSTVSWTAYAKLHGFSFLIRSQSVSRLPDAVVGVTIIGLGLWAWQRGLVRLHPAGWIIALVGLVVFLLTPVEIMSAWGADVRQPLGYLFILIGFLDWQLPALGARRAFLAVVGLLLVTRLAVVEYAWSGLDVDLAETNRSFEFIKSGSKILIAEVDQMNSPPGYTLHYLPCEAMIQRSSLVSLAFSDPRQQVLTVKPPYRAITGGFNDDPPKMSELISPPLQSPETPGGRIYWVNWLTKYDYLYLLSTTRDAPNPLPGKLTKIYDAHHFQLYAVK